MTIEQHKPQTAEMGAYDQRDEQLARYLGLNPNNPADRAMVAVCRQYDFDPILKHVVVIPKGGVYITRDGLLHVAHRSGQFDGMVVEQDPTLVDGEWVAKVTVYRKDMRHGFTYPGRYPVSGSNRQYAQEMALKAAEAHALRRAFDVTGLPTQDEQRPTAQEAPQQARLDSVLNRPVTAEQVTPDPSPAPDVAPSAEPPAADEVRRGSEASAGEALLDTGSSLARGMFAAMKDAGITEKEDRLALCSEVAGREITSSAELTESEARAVIAEVTGR